MSNSNNTNNEVFTPDWYIRKLDEKFNCINSDIIDNCCGGGVWLKYAQDKGYKVWGCDIEERNCIETIKNLYGDGNIEVLKGDTIPKIFRSPGLIAIFKHNGNTVKNIVQANSLEYRMNFNTLASAEKFGNGLFAIE
jgi:hypothetical protein|tara:strand:- start:46 stop:456 length:411 start_codon:yes stop_codon:yes gene_type:complete